MTLPPEVPVMTLPNVTLFPQALLPLYIFEPRYRRMLADALQTNRLFSVAMRRPNAQREAPVSVAGLGLIRVAVSHKDGTSHLVLQGLTRVHLERVVRYKPYRVQRITALETPPSDDVTTDALLTKVRELLRERFAIGVPFPFPFMSSPKSPSTDDLPPFSAQEVLNYLDSIQNPEQAADLVSCAVLSGAAERQSILEAVEVEARLRHLIHYLMRDIQDHSKGQS